MDGTWILFLDLDGTFWDNLDVSSTTPPFVRVSGDTIRDQDGETLTIKPGALEFIAWARKNEGIISTCSWNRKEVALSALRELGAIGLFDYQRIDPEPNKYELILSLMRELEASGNSISPDRVFYLDDRDLHMPDIRKNVDGLNFLHMWKIVKSYGEAKEIISTKLGIREP